MIASVVGQEKRVGASTSVLPGYPDRSAYAGRSEALARASAFYYYVELGVEEEYACVGRGVAGQLATVVLVARRRPARCVQEERRSPGSGTGRWGTRRRKEDLKVLFQGVAVVGHALIGLAVLSELALYMVGLL